MWQEKNNELSKEFEFADFAEAFAFMQAVAAEAERRQHHPRWENNWNKVRVWLSTHAAGKVTDKDRSFAEFIEALYKSGQEPTAPVATGGTYKHIKLYADGGSRGNPGPSASGYVLLDEDDTVIIKSGVYLGITTNNQAEYQSLKFGLEEAQKLGASEVEVYMDSLLVINQMRGIFKVKNRDLWPIHEAIKEVAKQFKKITFTHVPREFNKLADAEVNETLDAEAKK
ncbi:MAG TPA: 4a-hydroxytetrahydrobiopterin dehydratase [Candidatus Limnocylindria bacterium]|nr:4a-hydroxytetrahydrobiopterin dehydratase [Candidatus Limnocylindria bacterium]